ncbi:MAG: HlyD family efflux transporter periplasmic adaptor subunit [Lysobacter sp.]|nr:MAG: HlyD family efflux transporter periplasmic adaptor subunit [Lysobacter sp.]
MSSPRRSRAQPCLLALSMLAALAGCTSQRGSPAAAVAEPGALIVTRGRVDIEGGLLPLGMTADGVIADVAVKEGERVTRGQVLISTDATPARLEVSLAQAHLEQAQIQSRLLESKAAAARIRAARLVEAARAHAGDGQSADDAREAVIDLSAQWANARAATDIARVELRRANYQASQHVLRAPVDGDVLRIAARPGMHVSAQSGAVLTLLPAQARIVRAELSQDFVDAVHPGSRAEVVSDDGRQTAIGRAYVLRVGPAYGQSSLQEDPMQRVNERSVECVLGFDKPSVLRVGERVLVRFSRATERLAKPAPRTL